MRGRYSAPLIVLTEALQYPHERIVFMNKKIPLGIAVGLICIAVVISSAVTMSVVSDKYNDILGGMPEKIERYKIIDELDKIINNNYYGKKNEESFELAFAHGYVDGLGDNYSRFLSADEYAEYMARSQGEMSGIGIEYQKNKSGYILVTNVYDNSPAQSAGLADGDVIVAFDGIMIDANNYNEMEQKLSGDKLTSVNITYRRNSKDTTVNIVKGYEAKSVSSKAYGNVGYIKISDFYASTAEQTEQAVNSFVSSDMKAVVIDVRDNASTNFDACMKVLDIFVPINDASAPAAVVVDENGKTVTQYTTSSGEVNLPMAVLINANTAAAAELFACNMRDFGKAELVGNSTKGIGLKREVFQLSDGSAVLLSVGEVKPYRSESFNTVGLTPDLESELKTKTKQLASDSQFLDALTLVSPSVDGQS